MKAKILIWLVLLTCAVGTTSWPQCPEDTVDRGTCDTLYIEPWPPDLQVDLKDGPPYFVRVLLLVTHDQTVAMDSIGGFVIPLAYTHSNPTKYCSTSAYWNTTSVFHPLPDFSTRSIFRHVVNESDPSDTIYHNRMADLAADFSGREWDMRLLDISSGTDFWLALIINEAQDQFWWEGNRVLLATMTFKLEDTMTVCIDSTFWPPAGRFLWARMDSKAYIPRHNLPVCFNVSGSDFTRGDVNGDGAINVGDVIHLVNFLYRDGDPPLPMEAGDFDCDGALNVGDVVWLVNYLFRDGPPPPC